MSNCILNCVLPKKKKKKKRQVLLYSVPKWVILFYFLYTPFLHILLFNTCQHDPKLKNKDKAWQNYFSTTQTTNFTTLWFHCPYPATPQKIIQLMSKSEVLKENPPCCHNSLVRKDAYLNSNIVPLLQLWSSAVSMKVPSIEKGMTQMEANSVQYLSILFFALSHFSLIHKWQHIKSLSENTINLFLLCIVGSTLWIFAPFWSKILFYYKIL